jgi:hypothetical protein
MRTACETVALPRGPTEGRRRRARAFEPRSNGVVSSGTGAKPGDTAEDGPGMTCSSSSSFSSSSSSSKSSPAYVHHSSAPSQERGHGTYKVTKQQQEIDEVVRDTRFSSLFVSLQKDIITSESSWLMDMFKCRVWRLTQARKRGRADSADSLLICMPFVDIMASYFQHLSREFEMPTNSRDVSARSMVCNRERFLVRWRSRFPRTRG